MMNVSTEHEGSGNFIYINSKGYCFNIKRQILGTKKEYWSSLVVQQLGLGGVMTDHQLGRERPSPCILWRHHQGAL